MTAYEFRGFIANLILDAIIITSIFLMIPSGAIPIWGYVLIGLGVCLIIPIPPANFRARPAEDELVNVKTGERIKP